MRIKAVSEYIKVHTRQEAELPCVAIERDGTCRLTIRYSRGISQSQMDNVEVDGISFIQEIKMNGFFLPEYNVEIYGGIIEESESKYKKTLAIFNGNDNLFDHRD